MQTYRPIQSAIIVWKTHSILLYFNIMKHQVSLVHFIKPIKLIKCTGRQITFNFYIATSIKFIFLLKFKCITRFQQYRKKRKHFISSTFNFHNIKNKYFEKSRTGCGYKTKVSEYKKKVISHMTCFKYLILIFYLIYFI